jgi:hypothetical protein
MKIIKDFVLVIALIILAQSCSHNEVDNDKHSDQTTPDTSTHGESKFPNETSTSPGRKISLTNKWSFNFNQSISKFPTTNDIYFVGNVDSVKVIRDHVGKDKLIVGYISVGSWEAYRDDQALLKPFCKKKYKGYPDECYLDLTKWRSYVDVMMRRLDKIKSDGYDAVYFDNSWSFKEGVGTLEQNIEYIKMLVDYCRFHGLIVGINNAPPVAEVVKPDFMIQESCIQFNECDLYNNIVSAGIPIFHLEFSTKYCRPVSGHSVKVYEEKELNKHIKDCDKI